MLLRLLLPLGCRPSALRTGFATVESKGANVPMRRARLVGRDLAHAGGGWLLAF
jgi:hypothetical protein